ncbi:hypothetical protein FVO59_08825 [Microbacterium esteraromaticum]|uniref:Uncharacterized protein n=1 Tax=Microbacterium esteraromaticum TaxID=57043 RepID=A0A7D7WG54_9MICO|nr:hypothetical protein [Microbacterium esteraromaticum]QMU97311.1 hypothetical protein FVO59_08825 [Microbacterium esteraromaticum]
MSVRTGSEVSCTIAAPGAGAASFDPQRIIPALIPLESSLMRTCTASTSGRRVLCLPFPPSRTKREGEVVTSIDGHDDVDVFIGIRRELLTSLLEERNETQGDSGRVLI